MITVLVVQVEQYGLTLPECIQKGGDRIASSVDPEQTAPIWFCTVCPDLSVPILRIFTVHIKRSIFIQSFIYRIFPAIRRGFRPSRMTSNNLISPMKFCYNTNSTLPKQCQSSRSVLQDGSRTFGLFWKEKNPVL